MLDILPRSLLYRLKHRFGHPQVIESLRGLTVANVWRVTFESKKVIIKETAQENEVFFYTEVSPILACRGIPSPELLLLEVTNSSTWLVLEHISQPFPQNRWLADVEQLTILKRLHKYDVTHWREQPSLFRPQWTRQMTEAALTWFTEELAATLRTRLEGWRQAAQPIFVPLCLVSGDPNPMNWGLRQNGQLVHFDWERFGWGTPAIDLAITIPGFGKPEDFRLVAERYLSRAGREQIGPLKTSLLAAQIMLAKGWAVVELLSNLRLKSKSQHGEAGPDSNDMKIDCAAHLERPTLKEQHDHIITHLQKEFPTWLRQFQDF